MYLTFIDDGDFEKAESFIQKKNGAVEWRFENNVGEIREDFIREWSEQVGTETVVIGQDAEGEDIKEEQPVFERRTKDVWERLEELDAAGTISVQWLTQADKDAIAAEEQVNAFRSSRQQLLNSAVVTANTRQFDADEQSISRMANAILAAQADGMADTDTIQWSLADTGTGVMTDITLGDLKEAHKLAVMNMASIWSID